jgi:hypothetical protein
VHDELVPHPMHARTPTVRVELEQRISTHEETLEKAVRNNAGEGGSEHGTMDQRKHHLTVSESGGETRTTNASELHVHASTHWQGLLT